MRYEFVKLLFFYIVFISKQKKQIDFNEILHRLRNICTLEILDVHVVLIQEFNCN